MNEIVAIVLIFLFEVFVSLKTMLLCTAVWSLFLAARIYARHKSETGKTSEVIYGINFTRRVWTTLSIYSWYGLMFSTIPAAVSVLLNITKLIGWLIG